MRYLFQKKRETKKEDVTKKSLQNKRKELKTWHENVTVLKLHFWEMTLNVTDTKTKPHSPCWTYTFFKHTQTPKHDITAEIKSVKDISFVQQIRCLKGKETLHFSLEIRFWASCILVWETCSQIKTKIGNLTALVFSILSFYHPVIKIFFQTAASGKARHSVDCNDKKCMECQTFHLLTRVILNPLNVHYMQQRDKRLASLH